MKPIFAIGLPNATFKEVNDKREDFKKKLYDYHVIVFNHRGTELKMECFYEKDMKKADLQTIKKFIEEIDA